MAKDTTHTTHQASTPVNSSKVAKDPAQATQKTERKKPVNRSQVAKDTAHTTPHTERAQR